MGAQPSRPRFARCPLRPFLHHNPDIAGAVLRIFLRAIRTTLRDTSPGAPRDAKLGAISFLHRFGSSLNTHFHYHCVILDGAFSHGLGGDARFHEATHLESHHWHELQRVVQRRVLRYFRARGLLDEADAHGMLDWRGSGGFSIDASVRILGDDRQGVERLIRGHPPQVGRARPAFALERLHAPNGAASLNSPDARLLYRFPKPGYPPKVGPRRPHPDPALRFSFSNASLDLCHRAPTRSVGRVHRNRYHGVLAPNATLRPAVVAIGRPQPDAPDGDTQSPPPLPSAEGPVEDPVEPTRPANPARIRWAVLLARIYEVLPLLCPACGGTMTILAFLTDPPVVSAILLHLELPHRPPPISPARGPPQGDFLDQTPAFDPDEGGPAPEFVFDQSLPVEFED